MYDIILIEKLTCPHCRQSIEDFEFQSKELNNGFLEKYSFPDVIKKEDGKYPLEGMCDVCNSFIKGKVFVENGITKKISYWVDNSPVNFLVPNLDDSLKKNIIGNKYLREENIELKSALAVLLVKIKNKEEFEDDSLKEIEKIFSISISDHEKIINKEVPSWTLVTGSKKYYILLSKKEK